MLHNSNRHVATPRTFKRVLVLIWTAGLNWYPNNAIRFLLDYQHTDVSRLSSTGGDLGASLSAVSLRAQLAL